MSLVCRANRLLGIVSFFIALSTLTTPAQADIFKSGWVLDGAESSLTYDVVYKERAGETHALSNLQGKIEADGAATVSVDLASIETKDDLRNTRMRYVLFETFKFPKATISSKLDERLLAGLDDLRIYNLDLRFTLELHGVGREMTVEAVATMLDDETVSIASVDPVFIRAKDFGLTGGLQKLEQAYFAEVAPYAAVSFDFVFKALPHVETPDVVVAEIDQQPAQDLINGRSTAVEAKEVCLARLNALRPTGSLHFRNGSHQLSSDSLIVLANVAGAIRPCEALKITVAGHTDAIGDAASNKILSQRRADHVTDYLRLLGLPETRVYGEGYGESRPVAPNDTAENRSKNRRIEFRIIES